MKELIKRIRESIVGALAYVRAHQHDENSELEEFRQITDEDLDKRIDEIDDYLEGEK